MIATRSLLMWLMLLLLILGTLAACGAGSVAPAAVSATSTTGAQPHAIAAAAQSSTMTQPAAMTARYVVPTMTCPSCPARITASAKKDAGVLDVAADFATQQVTVTYDPSKTNSEQIAQAIRQGGDTVQPVP